MSDNSSQRTCPCFNSGLMWPSWGPFQQRSQSNLQLIDACLGGWWHTVTVSTFPFFLWSGTFVTCFLTFVTSFCAPKKYQQSTLNIKLMEIWRYSYLDELTQFNKVYFSFDKLNVAFYLDKCVFKCYSILVIM